MTNQDQPQSQPQFKIVYVLTNTPDSTVKTLYANSLATSTRLCMLNGIKVVPLFLSLVTNQSMAKNELLARLTGEEYLGVVFIDADLGWDPITFLGVVQSPENVVALPVIKKVPNGVVFDLDVDIKAIETTEAGLLKVNHASFGFMRLSKAAVTQLLDTNPSVTNNTGTEVKNVFECSVRDGKFFNESIVVCTKLKDLGFDILLDPSSTCSQLATGLFATDFASAVNTANLPGSPMEMFPKVPVGAIAETLEVTTPVDQAKPLPVPTSAPESSIGDPVRDLYSR